MDGTLVTGSVLTTALFLAQTVSSADQIPELNPKGRVYKTEGPTDYAIYPKAHGVIRAVMVFVDFPDVPAEGQETEPIANHLLGDGKAQQFFKDQSYGKMSLDVTIIAGWKRMPRPVGEYVNSKGGFSFEQHKVYLTDACALFPALKFSTYQMVYVVAVKTPTIRLSPAFNAHPGTGAKTADGEVRLAVTFGNDSYKNRCTNLIHETGHLLGLPDLYRYDDQGFPVGAWDIMCDIFKGTNFLGWHRHKLGWLDGNRKEYLRSGTLRTTLTPLSSSGGVSMIVVPGDNPDHPSKVWVVEIAEPVLSPDEKLTGEGILIYSVDATIATGQTPVVIYPKRAEDNDRRLYQAPFRVGDSFQEDSAPMTAKIERKTSKGYEVVLTRK